LVLQAGVGGEGPTVVDPHDAEGAAARWVLAAFRVGDVVAVGAGGTGRPRGRCRRTHARHRERQHDDHSAARSGPYPRHVTLPGYPTAGQAGTLSMQSPRSGEARGWRDRIVTDGQAAPSLSGGEVRTH